MASIVYALTNSAMPGLVKIGYTLQEDATVRIGQLYSSGVPFPFKLEFACRVLNLEEVERALHTAFAPQRVNPKRAFFKIEPGQAIAILKLLHTEDATASIDPSPPGIGEQEISAGEQYRARRPNLNFIEMGIPIGSVLKSTVTDDEAVVTQPKKVRFRNEESSLTAATRQALGLDYSVAPAPYWTFDGRSLSDIYEATYPADE